jgi:hypothetical protein
VADVPKGAVEGGTFELLAGKRGKSDARVAGGVRLNRAWLKALQLGGARGVARFGAGALTAPVFVSGLKNVASDDKKKRRKGYVQVVGSGTVYSAAKGGLEGVLVPAEGTGKVTFKHPKVESFRTKAPKPKSKNLRIVAVRLKQARGLGSKGTAKALARTRAVTGAGAAILTARSIGRGSKSDNKKTRFLVPAVMGAAAGVGKGVVDETSVRISQKAFKNPKLRRAALKAIGARGVSRGAAGAFGALATTELVRAATGHRKKASYIPDRFSGERDAIGVAATAAALGYGMSRLPASAADGDLAAKLLREARQRGVDVSVGNWLTAPQAGRGLVSIPESISPGTLAHELGHAEAGALRQRLLHLATLNKMRVGGAVVGGVGTALALRGAGTDRTPEGEKMRAAAALLAAGAGGAAQVPALVEEGISSGKALRLLAKARASRGAMARGAAQMAGGYASYLLPATIPLGIAVSMHRKAQRRAESHKSAKPRKVKQAPPSASQTQLAEYGKRYLLQAALNGDESALDTLKRLDTQ